MAMGDTVIIPLNRQYFHDKINNEQKKCDKSDGILDGSMDFTKDKIINLLSTAALYSKIDELQDWVESTDSSNNSKIRALGYLENTLQKYRNAWKAKSIEGSDFSALISSLESIIKQPDQHKNISEFISDKSYETAKILTEVFYENMGIEEAKKKVYIKYCHLHPSEIITSIHSYINEPFVDSLIYFACKKNPSQIYTYAQSNNTIEGKLIHRSNIGIVKTIATLSTMPNALMYFPFLDEILSGNNSIDSIQKLVGNDENAYDSVGYFKLLVKTEIEYFKRFSTNNDTAIAMFGPNGLREVLKDRAIRHFITPINNLHEQANLDIRMKAIDLLSPSELYFMIVMGENDIYTSSFKHSFNRMMQRLGKTPHTDSLLLEVGFDFFKKFIKMCASYNKLDTFLNSMSFNNSQSLMKEFVSNLDKPGSLEDATDVADSYSSINNLKLKKSIADNIIENERKAILKTDENGVIIYSLLKNIFLSEDTSNHIDLTKVTGIPSIYELDKKSIQDDSGQIIEQVFFYGDEDGKHFFPLFLNSFSTKDWKIIQNTEWVEIRSIKNNVIVFANKPLDYDANLDDTAQFHLIDYLNENNLKPSIVVHRGHSYWLPGTINRMPDDIKIMLIGSCGGYKNLNKILAFSPNANIISTKEIGAGDINKPIINYLNQALLNDKKIVWKDMWKSLTKLFSHDPNRSIRESWESYIPPYRNLGAIFLKAYIKKTELR